MKDDWHSVIDGRDVLSRLSCQDGEHRLSILDAVDTGHVQDRGITLPDNILDPVPPPLFPHRMVRCREFGSTPAEYVAE